MGQFILENQQQTEKLAKLLARACLADSAFVAKATSAKEAARRRRKILKHTLIFGLVGNLGAGKTTFIQAFAKGLGIKAKITSPTFVLMKNYKNLYHLDCYRIKNSKDVLDLDFKEIISIPKNIIMIEWAEKIRKILPKNTIWIKFEILGKNERKIKIS